MLENYVEKSISRQIIMMSLLFDKKVLPLEMIQYQTGLSPSKIKDCIKRLSELFEGKIKFKCDKTKISCIILSKEPFDAFHMIYSQSIRLQALKFLLPVAPKNRIKSVSRFAKEHFISTPSAYRIIQYMVPFIEECGFKLEDNNIVGEEWRLRYLIALLHAKFGIITYNISDEDLHFIHEFVFSTKRKKSPHPLLDKKYLFFDVLLTLSWKRRDFTVAIPHQSIFTKLKELSIYTYFDLFFNEKGKALLNVDFPNHEIDYIFLVYLTVNNALVITEFSEEDFVKLFPIIQEDRRYGELLTELSLLFKQYIVFDRNCIRTLLPYIRKTLFDLQCFIPSKYYYSAEYHGNQELLERLTLLINNWSKSNSGVGNLTSANLHLLCLRLEQLIKENLPPLVIAVVEINKRNMDILYSLVFQYAHINQVKVQSFNVLLDSYTFDEQTTDLIITTAELTSFIKERLNLSQRTKVMGLNFDFIDAQSDDVLEVIRELRKQQFQDAINCILDD
ncbi:helix-turn-helix domain-containing protein [Streptococcus halichoeri]|uniref:helix-turn-helix domain-containing protein n=1 Tax=Streptococcus halichoeri TaxID=254785 RepID=UPI00135BEF99|nr:helix-turn-helix domain-containing protein [Streptococcus halichoeri]